MNIDLHKIPVREVIIGYKDSAEEGVVAYGGKLDIRPKYQREFVYTGKQRDAVLETVKNGFPLNVMYWVKTDQGNFEVMDGQQRTISVGQYVNGDFSLNDRFFHNLTKEEQDQILDYELMIYFCEGTDKERLDWFRIINIAGEKLTDQEIRNAVYTGPWLSDAKLKFSKTHCAAYLLANTKYRKEMKGVEWGRLYNKYKKVAYDAKELEEKALKLIDDDEVQSLKGIYEYILTGEGKHLNLRQFDDKTKRKVFEKQKGKCVWCKKTFEFEEMEADHITPWHEGGKTTVENCQMLCKDDNRKKSGK